MINYDIYLVVWVTTRNIMFSSEILEEALHDFHCRHDRDEEDFLKLIRLNLWTLEAEDITNQGYAYSFKESNNERLHSETKNV